jgi:hypothetical protein
MCSVRAIGLMAGTDSVVCLFEMLHPACRVRSRACGYVG